MKKIILFFLLFISLSSFSQSRNEVEIDNIPLFLKVNLKSFNINEDLSFINNSGKPSKITKDKFGYNIYFDAFSIHSNEEGTEFLVNKVDNFKTATLNTKYTLRKMSNGTIFGYSEMRDLVNLKYEFVTYTGKDRKIILFTDL